MNSNAVLPHVVSGKMGKSSFFRNTVNDVGS
jgi:hypothetical protein